MIGDDAYGATIAKRKLSRILTELRVRNRVTANHVCDRLTWGRGKVGRAEANNWVRPEMSDVRDLLRIYDADEATRRMVEDLAVRARVRAWWRSYDDVWDNEFPGFENDASLIRNYMPLVVPGLLQTPAYIESQMSLGGKPDEWRQLALEGRLRRQQILDRDDGTAPELVVVITEAALRYHWGTPGRRRDQVAHLIEMGERQTVEIRVLRFADGWHPGMSSLINIFGFPEPDEPDMVYRETDTSMEEVTYPEEQAYVELFERIREAASPPGETTAFLNDLVKELELSMKPDLSHSTWRKARASASANGGCVELATGLPAGHAAMRDSTRPAAGAHLTSAGALSALLADVKAGRYDI